MGHQWIYTGGVLILLLLCTMVKSEETMTDLLKMRTQDSMNIVLVKGIAERLEIGVEVLQKNSNTEINMLKAMQTSLALQSTNDDVCERIHTYFNSTLRKYNQFEDRIMAKLDELQDEQTANTDKLMVRQNLSKNCQQSSALDIMSESLSEMSNKIDSLETKLNKLLEVNNEQMTLLRDLSTKLKEHHEKLDNFETKLPTLTRGETSSPGKQTVPMDLLIGMAKSQWQAKNK